jgi:pimeloyl-ACP methyl ester carboxylesterase
MGATETALPCLPELKLSQVPPAARARYDGDRFSYMEAGAADAVPLVLLHGVGANATHWRFQLADLSDRWRVIAWNAPGYMLSDSLVEDSPDCRSYADALADFLSSVGVGRLHILANSFGARVAQCFAAHYPGRVMRMVLTGAGIGRKDMPDAEKTAAIAERERQIGAGGYAFGARVSALLSRDATPETIALVQDVLRLTNRRGFMQAVRFGLSAHHTPDFADRLSMPVLLLQGAEDRVNPTDRNAAVLANALPDARLAVLDGAGHLPEIEQWRTVNALVADFLSA